MYVHDNLVEISLGNGAEDTHGDSSDDQCTNNGLQEDCVLDLAESGLLDPDFAIQDFADEITLLVFSNPRFVFVAIGAGEGVE